MLRDQYILKLNPMANWSREPSGSTSTSTAFRTTPCTTAVTARSAALHCTRPTAEGENERAGRWTGFDKAECGIHTFLGSNI